MAEIPDGGILPDGEFEIAATGGQYEGAVNRGSPDRIAVNDALDVVQHRVTMIASFRELCIFVGSQHDRVRTIDADKTQLG